MSLVLFLFFLIISSAVYFYYRKTRQLTVEIQRLQEDFARYRENKEAFSIEMEKSNSELTVKTTDSLTGLPGRPAFEDRLRQAISQAAHFQISFAVMAMDIDDFSQIDQGAPGIRDELIVQISQRMTAAIRQVDSATRFAGSHFVILLPQLSQPETAAYVANRIQESILQPFSAGEQEWRLSASLGIAIYPLDGEDVETLLQKASSALMEARRHGKNKYYFWHREIHALSERESQIFVSLRSQDVFDHLVIRYCPQVISSTSRMIGIEARVRMEHPTLGLIESTELIKMAEHCGRATEMMAWVFRRALQEARRCYQTGNDPMILALSVTSRQIENAHFVFQMSQIAREVDRKVVQPVFEINDSPSRVQSSLIQKGFSTLAESGVRFAIQMVAVSHNLLQKFPIEQFSYLKMDIRLVNSTIRQPEGDSILSSMMTLTNSSGLEVLVDGVDEEGQRQYLMELGFQRLQGKMFEHLIPGQEFLVG